MLQRDDRVYVGHMLDTANKAIGFVQVKRQRHSSDQRLI
jgi:uncharacterized protein with HEPN domain